MKHQSYPFKPAKGAENDDRGNNMLLYLEMTDTHKMPIGALDTSDNWVKALTAVLPCREASFWRNCWSRGSRFSMNVPL